MANNENTRRRGSLDVKRLVYLALFTAIVFLLQIISLFMRGPAFSITLVLVPIVIAVAICGTKAGPWLGFVFGVAVLVSGDANAFIPYNPLATVAVVLLKGILAGLVAALVYRALENKNRYLAVILAAISAPITNTAVFFLGSITIFSGLIADWAGGSQNVFIYTITGIIGINFIIEVAINLVLVPVIYRIIEIAKGRVVKKTAVRTPMAESDDNGQEKM